jgi:hypothetical protein
MQYELVRDSLKYMLGITHNGVRREVVATMKPYENGNLIKLLKEREAAFVSSNTDSDALDLRAGDAVEANHKFFDLHKITVAVDGKEASDAVIAKLDALYKIKTMVIGLGYLNVDDVKADAAENADFDLEVEFADTVKQVQSHVMVGEDGKECTLEIAHILRFPTTEDRIKWDRAQKLQAMKEGGRRVRYNYETIGHLYDAMVKEAQGFTINGQPCVESNKAEWVKLIPYIFKFRALDSLFALATEKNG